MKGGESSMEQTEILLAIQQQLTILQSTIDTLREQSRQKDEEIERLRQIILNLQRTQFGQRSEKRTYASPAKAGRKSARWKNSARRCLWKRESWICRTMKR